MNKKELMAIALVLLVGTALAWIILRGEKIFTGDPSHEAPGAQPAGREPAKGPHGGRWLSQDDLQLEVTLYERGVPPQFRVYAFEKGRPIRPDEVKLTLELHRLGGRVEVIRFRGEGDYLRGDRVVAEPHSFDVRVRAERQGRSYRWEYAQVEGRVRLAPEAVRSAGISVETAGPARMRTLLELPGEIRLNADKLAHVVPRLSGVAIEVRKNLGDAVRKGELLVVLDSRELADLQSELLASIQRLELARATFKREEDLWRKRISAEQDYLASRQVLAEAEIHLQAAAQKLRALGLSQAELDRLPASPGAVLTRYEVRAPFDGLVIEKHLALGEAVKEDAAIFLIADLSAVWVEVTVYAKDLNAVRVGKKVTVRSKALGLEAAGTLAYLGPLVGEETRTARARVVLPNPKGDWRPGLFVTVELVQEEVSVPVAVPVGAIQTFRDWSVVFVQYGDLFEVRPLKLGRSDGRWVEILEGLSAGERYAVRNSFVLKAELGKAGATHEH